MTCKNWGFCDLSVSKKFELDKLKQIEVLGYNTVAINTYIEELDEEPKKKKKKGESKDYIPPPVEISQDVLESTKLNILQRVTIEFSESSIAHRMNQSENLRKYDIIAVIPKTLQAFQYACGTMDIDMISFETEGRVPFKINRKLYRQAVERGLFFEIIYSPAIRGSTARKNIINISHTYHAVGKSKNIILSSGAENYIHIRDVHNVINLGFIFGLNSNQALEVIRNNPRRLILKAQGRRCGKHYMIVTPLDDVQENKETQN
ncbi:hypothetical protein K1T71_005727 [Dendrolimus kikuchii]|uniref:Uncharacterized protein n=1 Tax=Dendrolimus kikuchii TaxID=765133 RepID=A0ACC1D519_9NEOP|nr:hypothetical protein K1T71_005727 [Dendrolimus kikuchii]